MNKTQSWQETTMTETQRNNIFYHGIGTLEGVCQMQAQITGDIAYKAGIEKVVKWVESKWENTPYESLDDGSPIIQIQVSKSEWLTFKEELR